MTARVCANCAWWDGGTAAASSGVARKCRRLPPKVAKDLDGDLITAWPYTFADEMCGWHEAKPAPMPGEAPARPSWWRR